MDELMRCPICHRVPAVMINDNLSATIECGEHGHMAMGSSLEQAVSHWNIYIQFVMKAAA